MGRELLLQWSVGRAGDINLRLTGLGPEALGHSQGIVHGVDVVPAFGHGRLLGVVLEDSIVDANPRLNPFLGIGVGQEDH